MKLWLYFVLFTALIFIVLWLLQTVFIQNFYNDMLISNTKEAADKITASYTDENIGEIIDDMSLNNSILVYITDSDSNIIYCSDQFKGLAMKNHGRQLPDKDNTFSAEKDGNQIGEKHIFDGGYHQGAYRSLPEGYNEFVKALILIIN